MDTSRPVFGAAVNRVANVAGEDTREACGAKRCSPLSGCRGNGNGADGFRDRRDAGRQFRAVRERLVVGPKANMCRPADAPLALQCDRASGGTHRRCLSAAGCRAATAGLRERQWWDPPQRVPAAGCGGATVACDNGWWWDRRPMPAAAAGTAVA
ncbi:hypothetical protein I553_10289 [Mycobacterium xenopi 4042]|uniref:Uncharacterized protein n=1 Tax=Mycobacterium xenopi 4042 TaxID=1299334 RepID=X8ANL7_MYCXE|nr:hypothetical protein I553_10289 [Mycobacterium xenopi 4042]